MVLERMVQEQLVLDHKSRPKSQKKTFSSSNLKDLNHVVQEQLVLDHKPRQKFQKKKKKKKKKDGNS